MQISGEAGRADGQDERTGSGKEDISENTGRARLWTIFSRRLGTIAQLRINKIAYNGINYLCITAPLLDGEPRVKTSGTYISEVPYILGTHSIPLYYCSFTNVTEQIGVQNAQMWLFNID